MSDLSDLDEGRIVKHSLVVAGHRTSISLEGLFWQVLRAIAANRGVSLAALVREVDALRGAANLSSALRTFVLRDVLARESAAQAATSTPVQGSPS